MKTKHRGLKSLLATFSSAIMVVTMSSSAFASQKDDAEKFINGELEPLRAIDSGVLPNSLHSVPLELKDAPDFKSMAAHKTTREMTLKRDGFIAKSPSVSTMATTSCASGCPQPNSAATFLDDMLRDYETYPYYYGVVKSPEMVAKDKSGNAFELASLYASVIDTNNLVFDWRYAFGRIQLTGEQVKEFVGVDNAMEAANLLHTSGYSVSGSVDAQGNLVIVQFNHVWLQVKETSSSSWVDVDPSFKGHTIPDAIDLNAQAGVDSTALLDRLSATGALDNPNGIMLPDISIAEEVSDNSQALVGDYLQANQSLSYDDVINTRSPYRAMYLGFGQPLPYIKVGTPSTSKTFASNHLHKIRVTMGGMNHTIELRNVIGKRLTVSYEGATSADRNTINANGGLLGLNYQSVNLVPKLKADGVTLATGSANSLGSYQELTVTFLNGNTNDGAATHFVTVGGIHAIALDPQHISESYIDEQITKLNSASNTYRSNAMDERYSGQLMHVLGLSYFKQLDNAINNVSTGSGAMIYHKISEALMSIDLTAERAPNGEYKMAVGSRGIDAPRNIYSIFSFKNSNPVDKAAVLFATGVAASGLEHAVFEKTLGWPSNSTMSILRFAALHEVPIYVIKSENLNTALAEIDLPANIETSMRNAVNSGRIVITPKEQLLIGEWNGIGYIVLDPVTGAAGYLINGGNAGGKQAFEPMDLAETNTTWFDDVVNYGDSLADGALYGEHSDRAWDDPLLQGLNDGATFVSDLFIVGDVRNLTITGYNAIFEGGEWSDVALAGIGFVPLYDMGKAGYKVADGYFDTVGLTSVKSGLDQVSSRSDQLLANLSKNGTVESFGLQTLDGGWKSGVTQASRNGMGYTNVTLQDGDAYVRSLGLDPGNLSNANKGLIGERASQMYARSQNLEPIFVTGNPSANGIDNIYKDSNGNFIIEESKFVSGSGNAGLSGLSSTADGRQLTNEYIFGRGNKGGALSRTSGLSDFDKQKIRDAYYSGKVKTRYTVVKDRHAGAGVTQGLTKHPDLGVGGTSQIGEIVIIELPLKN